MHALRFELCEEFSQILAIPQAPKVLAVDIPIGLLDTPTRGGRVCDRQARRVLGRGRQSSVFTPPTRHALTARNYREAIRLNGQGISRQAYGILAKIREVDAAMSPALQQVIYEAHPELAFVGLAGGAVAGNKKTLAGRRERERLLRRYYARHYVNADALCAQFGRARVAVDDVFDAYALGWVAVRIATGSGMRLPASSPPCDSKGLRMEIWY